MIFIINIKYDMICLTSTIAPTGIFKPPIFCAHLISRAVTGTMGYSRSVSLITLPMYSNLHRSS